MRINSSTKKCRTTRAYTTKKIVNIILGKTYRKCTQAFLLLDLTFYDIQKKNMNNEIKY